MQTLDLFAGIGGFPLAARWIGWETIAWCEWDPFCRKALKYHFPNAKGHGDIKKTDFTRYAGRVGILTAGFPCQPVSTAGARKGVKDDRWGWPETRRAIGESRPDWVVLENVAGLFSILEPESLSELERKEVGLFCEDEEYQDRATIERVQQRVIARIVQDIEQDGYLLPRTVEGRPIVLCIPACAVNAPHRRDRVWIVAKNSDQDGRRCEQRESESGEREQRNACAGNHERVRANGGEIEAIANTFRRRCKCGQGERGMQYEAASESCAPKASCAHGEDRITANSSGPGCEKLDLPAKPGFAGFCAGRCDADAPNAESSEREQPCGTRSWRHGFADLCAKYATHPTSCGRVQIDSEPEPGQFAQIIPDWGRFPTQPPVRWRNDGISAGLAGITVSRHRRESLKAYGNAIVPQVAYEIFKAIESTR